MLFNREIPGFASVITDSRDGSRQIIEHLAALGHRSIAYLSGPSALWTDAERWRTLSEKAARLGVEIVRLVRVHRLNEPELKRGAQEFCSDCDGGTWTCRAR